MGIIDFVWKRTNLLYLNIFIWFKKIFFYLNMFLLNVFLSEFQWWGKIQNMESKPNNEIIFEFIKKKWKQNRNLSSNENCKKTKTELHFLLLLTCFFLLFTYFFFFFVLSITQAQNTLTLSKKKNNNNIYAQTTKKNNNDFFYCLRSEFRWLVAVREFNMNT